MAGRIPVLSGLARQLETLMFGEERRLYRRFVAAVLVVATALVLANVVVWLNLLGLEPTTARLLQTAAAIAVSAFLIVGILQVLVLARLLTQESTVVAEQAGELESAAETVEEAASGVEQTADELETRAQHLEQRAQQLETQATDFDGATDSRRPTTPMRLASPARLTIPVGLTSLGRLTRRSSRPRFRSVDCRLSGAPTVSFSRSSRVRSV